MRYNAAQARLTQLQKGAGPADIAADRARVQRAQAQLDLLSAINPTDVSAAEAEVRRARAQLDLLAAGPRPEAIAAAEAEVANAKATLTQAKIALVETELRAPFAGTIAALDARVGEHVGIGSPMVRLADLTTLQIETDDLTELNVVRVRGRRLGDRHFRRDPRPHADGQGAPHQAAGRKQAGRHDLHRGHPA